MRSIVIDGVSIKIDGDTIVIDTNLVNQNTYTVQKKSPKEITGYIDAREHGILGPAIEKFFKKKGDSKPIRANGVSTIRNAFWTRGIKVNIVRSDKNEFIVTRI